MNKVKCAFCVSFEMFFLLNFILFTKNTICASEDALYEKAFKIRPNVFKPTDHVIRL